MHTRLMAESSNRFEYCVYHANNFLICSREEKQPCIALSHHANVRVGATYGCTRNLSYRATMRQVIKSIYRPSKHPRIFSHLSAAYSELRNIYELSNCTRHVFSSDPPFRRVVLHFRANDSSLLTALIRIYNVPYHSEYYYRV